jgi:hypothetical protein
VDLYGAVHRGLRFAHGEVLRRLATTSYAARNSIEQALDELENHLDLCASHLALEEAHYHPALEARCTDSSRELAEQHRGHERAFAELRALAARLSAASVETAPAIGRALYLRYASFVAEDLTHMTEEELVTLPVFHEHYTDSELTALQAQLLAAVPLRERSEFFRLIMAASSHEERMLLLCRLRAELPPPGVVESLMDSLRGVLAEGDHDRLVAAL